MKIVFSKMHGLGNDFVVIDDLDNQVELQSDVIQRLGDRRRGIGFDQLLLIQSPSSAGADFRYRVFNADGNEVEQCGNGIRCVARHLQDSGKISNNNMIAETATGTLTVSREKNGNYRVNMGPPGFDAGEIPLSVSDYSNPVSLQLNNETQEVMVLSMGNPHAVLQVDNLDDLDIVPMGQAIQQHELFPASVNVGFMQLEDPTRIRLRVYERGVGETLACGSGACAAVVAGIELDLLQREVNVSLQGGDLQVSWPATDAPVWMTGPATMVYSGEIEI